jgi:AmiR/NasT family two-component response regulator
VDVVYFLADPDCPDLHQPYSDDRLAALIAIVTFESPLEVQGIVEANVHGTVAKPIQPIGVLSCLASAMSQHRYEKRLSARIEKLDELLKTRRLVERATQILAAHRQIGDHDAATLLRRQAMNKHISLHENATNAASDCFPIPGTRSCQVNGCHRLPNPARALEWSR